MNNTTFVLNTVVALSYAFVIFAAPGRVIAQECLNHTKDNSWSLIAAEPKPIRSIDELTDGVYSLALASTRTSCGKGQEFLGFNNRTCTTSTSPDKTAGPVMRGPGSFLWREWIIRVLKTEVDGQKRAHVSLQAFVDPKVEDAKCLGFISNFYGNQEYRETCTTPPYGKNIFLNSTQDLECDASKNPQVWWLLPASSGAQGEFELQSANKPGECARTLAVEDCNYQPVLIQDPEEDSATSTTRKTWKLTRRYDAIFPSPPPVPTPVPVPSPLKPVLPTEIPGPVISAPSSTSSGYVTVTVESPGGSSACSVTSLVFSSSSSAIGSAVDTVTSGLGETSVSVPARSLGYNMIYATAVCSDGSTTERSNGLTVYYQAAGPTATPTPGFLQANLYGSNFGINLGQNDSQTFIKIPIVSGSMKSFDIQYIGKVSMSGIVAARMRIAARRRSLLVASPPIEVCNDITAESPVFDGLSGTQSLDPRDMSISGSALVVVPFNNTLAYFADIASSSFITDTTYYFEKVAMSGSAVLASVDSQGFALVYASNIASPSWQNINTSGMDWDCGGEIALSGTMAAVTDSSGILFYTTDITNPSWIEVPMPVSKAFSKLSLTGKQIACTDTSSNPNEDNIWYAPDITAITNGTDWTNIPGALRSIAISTPN